MQFQRKMDSSLQNTDRKKCQLNILYPVNIFQKRVQAEIDMLIV